jgi:hypothetical protein
MVKLFKMSFRLIVGRATPDQSEEAPHNKGVIYGI